MKATELRRGSLLDVDNNYWEVDTISKDELYFKENIEYNHILNAKPIPLTEEWYIKFGYEGMQELIVDMIHNAIHPISNNIALWGATISGLKVHELQNLYFTLTSKELMI